MQQFLGTLATTKKQSEESSEDRPLTVHELNDGLVNRVMKSHGFSREKAIEELESSGLI